MNNFLVDFLAVLVVILVSMTLHELMHGFVAYKLGDDTAKEEGRLTLNPIKHLDPVYSFILPIGLFLIGAPIFGGAKPVPVDSRNLKGREWGMALVALAGPITNILLAFVMFLLRFFLIRNFGLGYGIVDTVLSYFVTVNLGFAVFNLLPLPPLDGSRLVYAIAPDGVRVMMKSLERYGVWIVYGLILLFGGYFSSVISWGINGVYSVFLWIVGL